MKKSTWKEIEKLFNASNKGLYRADETPKNKYENIKKRRKKKYASEKTHAYETGGGPSVNIKFSDQEIAVGEIFGTSLTGGYSKIDCNNDDYTKT